MSKKKRGKPFEKGNEMHKKRKSHGPFHKGNQVWRLRKKNGSVTKYQPGELLDKFEEYVDYCLRNPLQELQLVKFKEHYEEADVAKMRAMSVKGFCTFAGISESTFNYYKRKLDLAEEAELIQLYCENAQYEGAAAGLLQHQIVARMIGLADKKEMKVTVEDMNEQEALEELRALQAELMEALSDDGLKDAARRTYVDAEEVLDSLPEANKQPVNLFPTSPKPEPVRVDSPENEKNDIPPSLKVVEDEEDDEEYYKDLL